MKASLRKRKRNVDHSLKLNSKIVKMFQRIQIFFTITIITIIITMIMMMIMIRCVNIIMLIRCAKAQQMFFLRRSPRPTCSSSASAFHSRKELRWSWWSLEGLRWWWWWWKWWWWSSLCGLPPHLCLSLKEIIILTDGKTVLVLMGVWDRALQIGTNIIYWYWYWYWYWWY